MINSTRHLDEDLCIDFLHGLVDRAKRQEVLAHVRVCAQCERLLSERTAERERVLASVPDALRGPAIAPVPRTDARRARTARRERALIPLGIGALAAAAALLVFALRPASSPARELRMLPAVSELTIWRDASERPPDAELLEGLTAYSREKFAAAIKKLQTPQPSHRLDVLRRVYLASAYAHDRRYDEGLAVLESIATDPIPDPWGAETRWAHWVALKHSGRHASADSVLHVLASEPGELGQRAREAAAADPQ
ncbi:MAG: hypothetical protein ACKVU1_07020 [bacterium]